MDEQHAVIGRQRSAEHHAADQIDVVDHGLGFDHLAAGKRDGARWKILERVGFGAAACQRQQSGEKKKPHELEW